MRLIDADALIEKLKQSPYSADGPFGKGYSEGSIVRMIERIPTQSSTLNITNCGTLNITDAEDSPVERKYKDAAIRVIRSGRGWNNEVVTRFGDHLLRVNISVEPSGWGVSREHLDEAEYDAHVAEMAGVAEAVEMEGCQ